MAVNIVQLRGQLHRNIRRPLEIDRRPIRYPKSARHLNRQQSPGPESATMFLLLPIIFRNNRSPPPAPGGDPAKIMALDRSLTRGTEKAHGSNLASSTRDSTIRVCISVASSFPHRGKRPVPRVFQPREISFATRSPGLIERREQSMKRYSSWYSLLDDRYLSCTFVRMYTCASMCVLVSLAGWLRCERHVYATRY